MIIYGWKQYAQVLAVPTMVCQQCALSSEHVLRQLTTKATLFFIPLFPINRKHTVLCTACEHEAKVPKEQAMRLAATGGQGAPPYPGPAGPPAPQPAFGPPPGYGPPPQGPPPPPMRFPPPMQGPRPPHPGQPYPPPPGRPPFGGPPPQPYPGPPQQPAGYPPPRPGYPYPPGR